VKTAEGIEYQGVALLTEPLKRLGGRLRSMTLRTLPQPEHLSPQQGFGTNDAVILLPFQPDQTPLAGMSDSVAQGEQLS
jgi:hypothetical protein